MLLLAWLGYRFKRRDVALGLTGVAALLTACFAFVADAPSAGIVWAFYLFSDLFNATSLVLFWAFVNDAFTADRATRLYGLIGLGGVLGGLAGASVVRWGVPGSGREAMLWLCVPVILSLGFSCRRVLNRSEFGKRPAVKREDCQIDCSTGEAWGLFRSSRYLTSLAVLVVCYEIVSSVTDFQFSATVEQTIGEPLRRDAFFGMLGQAQSLIAIVMQLLLTGLVTRRSGVGAALLVLPAALLMGTLGYLAVPTLLFATVLSVSNNSLSYSINQTAKEMLYIPLGPAIKNTIKTCIDVLIQRCAKVLGVAVNLAIVPFRTTGGLRWVSLVSVLVLVSWVMVVRSVGRRFDEMTRKAEEQWQQWQQAQTARAREAVKEEM